MLSNALEHDGGSVARRHLVKTLIWFISAIAILAIVVRFTCKVSKGQYGATAKPSIDDCLVVGALVESRSSRCRRDCTDFDSFLASHRLRFVIRLSRKISWSHSKPCQTRCARKRSGSFTHRTFSTCRAFASRNWLPQPSSMRFRQSESIKFWLEALLGVL